MRLVYFGSGDFGLPTLSRLAGQHDVALVVTQPDRPAGRHRKLTPTAIADFADRRGLALFKPENPNESGAVRRIRNLAVDAFVVVAYGHKLGPELLEGTFAINLHGSLLPKYRGAAPINWAVMNGERETGVSVITLAQTMDAGEILARAATPIEPQETAGELHDRLAELGPDLVLDTLRDYRQETLTPEKQDPAQVTRAPKLTKADGTVRFDQPAHAVRCRVHGLTPWPGCSVRLGEAELRLLRLEVAEEATGHPAPGEVLPDGAVACRPGSVHLLEVQRPGGRAMTFEAYRRGHNVPPGARMTPR